ncbi:MAG: DUF6247 family protein [Pseudonocardiaceae bacterium]
MTSSGIYQALERRGLAAGITGLRPHVLRHTWAHYVLEGPFGHDDEITHLARQRSIPVLSVRAVIVCGVTAAATPGPRHGYTGSSFSDATPAEVRAVLIPEEAAEFDQQWREVMARATETLDLSEVLATLESWRRVARLTAVAGPEAHRVMYRRAAARLAGEDIPADEPLTRIKARLGL